MKIHFIRHATMILHFKSKKILVDPMLSSKNTLSAVENVPNQNDNPLNDLPVSLDSLMDCDAVLVTHTHRDHFDDMAANLIQKSLPVLCQPEDEAKFKELGFTSVIPVTDHFEWENIKIIRTKGRHGHGAIAVKMAPVSGYVISAPDEPVVYLSGDTVWYSCTKKVMEKYQPEIVISFCGEARFAYGKAITMDAQDILSICKISPKAKVVAVHMDAWNHCRLTRSNLRNFLESNNISDQVFVPQDGEVLSF
ncbi:MBL fold metallo-hydrolase [Pseudobacteroides cellulosolvens]|uniref:Metallo-beta-lactamase domain-containing protein n=1 Tax=Pseudobacteroides cellulosolvens ATCC 35603 = DSM 2933 TaxID=398512 RepID=A0A0L6JG82_9FIRM|nr:MBL fold metallo-hydrolase [Pseudobacteroides cellulosolvens]KNY24886.1 hypothetical protein Bccel_0143 [Pseudobacteroides cellulosolvens ATCC 35603 = DSM 2933]